MSTSASTTKVKTLNDASKVLIEPKYNLDLTAVHLESDLKKLNNVYIRDENSKLVQLFSDGKKIEVQSWDDVVNSRLTQSTILKNLGIQNTIDPTTVQTYFKNCLFNTDINKCVEFLTNPNFHEDSFNVVNEMEPNAALHLLEAYGFPYMEEFYINRAIKRIATVDEWLKQVVSNSNLTIENQNNIKGNKKLCSFLSKLVLKVNNNRAILNKDIVSADTRYLPSQTGRISKLLPSLPRESSNVREVTTSFGTPSDLQNILLQLAIMQRFHGIYQSHSKLYGPMTGGSSQLGGGILSFNVKDLTRNSSHIFKSLFISLNNALNKINKKIDDTDINRIHQLLYELEEKETILNNSLTVIQKYLNTLNSGVVDDNTLNTLEEMEVHIKNRDKALKATNKRQQVLVLALQAATNAMYVR
jgi:hypothetical protein